MERWENIHLFFTENVGIEDSGGDTNCCGVDRNIRCIHCLRVYAAQHIVHYMRHPLSSQQVRSQQFGIANIYPSLRLTNLQNPTQTCNLFRYKSIYDPTNAQRRVKHALRTKHFQGQAFKTNKRVSSHQARGLQKMLTCSTEVPANSRSSPSFKSLARNDPSTTVTNRPHDYRTISNVSYFTTK